MSESVPSTILNRIFIRKSAAFAGYTFLLYDYFLTLPLEVDYIWNTSRSIIKTLFLTIRYWTLIGQTFIILEETGYLSNHSQRFCVAFTLYRPFYVVLCGEGIRLMVVMRACAIAGCKRFVAITWNILYVLFALSILGVVLYFFIQIGPPNFEYLDETGICFSPSPPHLWKILLTVQVKPCLDKFISHSRNRLVLDSFIVIIVYNSLCRLTGTSSVTYSSRLIRLLARDALLFYIATLLNSLLCIVCWTIWSYDPRNTLQEWISVPFLVVMGERLILNLRRLRGRSYSTRDISQEVRRQIAAMGIHGDPDPESDLGVGVELNRVGEQ